MRFNSTKLASFTLHTSLVFLVSACGTGDNSGPLGPIDTVDELPRYTIWLSDQRLSAKALEAALQQDINFADKLCASDTHRPEGWTTHFALISTHAYDRLDLIEKYQLDATAPVAFADTGLVAAPRLSDFIAQRGTITVKNPELPKTVRTTFSKNGRFAGYCDDTKGYTPTLAVLQPGENQAPVPFVARCDYEDAAVPCMSAR